MNFIAQQPPSSSPTPTIHPPIVEGSLLVAVGVYLLKEFVGFFKQKDANEEKLTSSLIQDLRTERSQQLHQMIGAVSQISASQRQVAGAIQKMSIALSDINTASQQNARIFSEIFAQLRSQERILLDLTNELKSSHPTQNGHRTSQR